MTHYHVGSNVPGYLPEGDVYTVSSKKEARRELGRMVREARESEWDLSLRERRTALPGVMDGYVLMRRANDPFDLGISFWWQPCQDDCSEDDA